MKKEIGAYKDYSGPRCTVCKSPAELPEFGLCYKCKLEESKKKKGVDIEEDIAL